MKVLRVVLILFGSREKPWMTKEVHVLLKQLGATFRSSDGMQYSAVRPRQSTRGRLKTTSATIIYDRYGREFST